MADHVCTTVGQLNTALATAVAGDNILVRGVEGGGSGYYQTTNDTTGVSEVRENAGFHFAHSGSVGNPITLKTYPGDTTPTLSNRASGSTSAIPFPTITFGLHSYIVIDGIKVDGAIFMFVDIGTFTMSGVVMSGGQTGNVIKNCEIWEGWETTGPNGNWSGIRIQGQTSTLVQNNYIHDINDLGNCSDTSSMCGIKIYSGINSIYEYNTIRRVVGYSQAACIDDKQDSIGNTHRFNWFEDVSTGPRIQNQASVGAAPATGTKFYQNVIILGNYNGRAFTYESGPVDDYEFYNNTIVAQSGSTIEGMVYAPVDAQDGAKFYNNIFYSPASTFNIQSYAPIFGGGGLCDYNHYSDTSLDFRYDATTYANLAAWQAVFDSHASSGSPVFTNLGTLDLTLGGGSPCLNTGKTGGTSGGSNVNKGAYLTGSETIGYTALADSPSVSPSASLSPSSSASPSPSAGVVTLPQAALVPVTSWEHWREDGDLSFIGYWMLASGGLSASASVSPSASQSPSASASPSSSPSSSPSRSVSPSSSASASSSRSQSPSASASPSSSVSASASPSPAPPPGTGSVKLTSVAIELGLGGRMRDIFVNEDFTQGCWPLSELVSTTFRDISGNGNHATLSGTGSTRGVATGLPEQHMGLASDGNVVLSVADDGITNGGINLQGGSIDVAFLVKTTTNTATERVIVTNRNASSHGWYVGLVSGAIRFRLRTTGGVDVFNFTRGAIADGAWHVVHCYYDPPTQEARIFIDGVLSGVAVVTTNTDPEYIGVGVKIFGGDPGGASGFIGSLAFVDIGREGNLTLCASLQAARVWTDVYTDVRMTDGLRIRYGVTGTVATDWVGSTGTCSFVLDNSVANSAMLTGLYSPQHANCRAGFTLGIPVRVKFVYGATVRYKFQGRIVSVAPEAGPIGRQSRRAVRVMATDWFDVAARSRYIGAATQVGQLSTDVLKYLMDFADQSPGSVSIDAGTQVFSFALDQSNDRDTILSEFGRIAPSEMMYLYMRGNDTDGMTFVGSTRFARTADTTLDATFTNSMAALETSLGTEGIINEVRATCYPPTVDAAATSILFSLTANSSVTHPIPAGGAITIDAPYSDPNDRPSEVGGTAVVTPVATTDYTGNSAADGSGADRTANLSVSTEIGASAVRAVISNTTGDTIFLTKFQVRGKGIYRYQATPAIAQHTESIQKYGTSPLDLDMPYQQSVGIAQSLATAVKDIYGLPTTRPLGMSLASNHDDTVMTQSLTREIGDHIGIAETITGLVAGTGYFIHSVEMECYGLHDLRTSWGLIPPWPPRLLVSYTGPLGTQVHDLDVAPLAIADAGNYTFVFNRTGDSVVVRGVAGGGGGGGGDATAGGGGGEGGEANTSGVTVPLSTTTYTGKVGASGAGGGSGPGGNGLAGGTTEFRVPAGVIHLSLLGGNGGQPGSSTTAGAGGTGGGAGGNGGAGGGGAGANGTNGTTSVTHAGGGGGGGQASSFSGGNGGNSPEQSGAAGGGGSTNGSSASGVGGSVGTGANSGGGGGGGGGLLLAGAYRGGGGGGGAGGAAAGGNAGAGGRGALTITKV